jgi:hypothetical protein
LFNILSKLKTVVELLRGSSDLSQQGAYLVFGSQNSGKSVLVDGLGGR